MKSREEWRKESERAVEATNRTNNPRYVESFNNKLYKEAYWDNYVWTGDIVGIGQTKDLNIS